LVLIYKSCEQDNPGIREFVLQLERGAEPGKPLVEPETGFIVKGGSNEEYYSAISKMRKMTGDLIID
jgi:hypothetical protein